MSSPRKSLTKSQLATAIGTELLQLLEEITDDGRLSVEEVNRLLTWLVENQSSELPSVGHLIAVLGRITEDGVITEEEISLLHGEIEKVLPADVRELVKFKRRHARLAARAERQAAEVAAREKARRTRPAGRFDFMVAGVHHDGRSDVLNALGDDLASSPVSLALEPDNPYDHNAIAVLIAGKHVGYVPRDDAAWLATELRTGRYEARVKKVLDGHRCPIPVIAGAVYPADDPYAKGQKAVEGVPATSVVPVLSGCAIGALVIAGVSLFGWILLMRSCS